MKGIILAGGSGTRLYPITHALSKQMMPIYDKPMIYYPLSSLMLAHIRDILIISTPHDLPSFKKLLGDGSQYGCSFSYIEQLQPKGLADAFILGETFMGQDSVCLILGDNIFYGSGFTNKIRECHNPLGGIIFAYHVAHPEHYGVVELSNGNVVSIEEKPQKPRSNYAIPGIYFYDNEVISISKTLTPSPRGELEITDVHKAYLQKGKLQVKVLERGTAWLDTGTFETLMESAHFIETIEKRQGLKVGCIEEIAYQNKFIDKNQLRKLAEPLLKSGYGQYLLRLLEE